MVRGAPLPIGRFQRTLGVQCSLLAGHTITHHVNSIAALQQIQACLRVFIKGKGRK